MTPRRSRRLELIDPETLLAAYAHGVFPMAKSARDENVYWVDPEARGVFPLDALHVPKRLARKIRTTELSVKPDTAFRDTMLACAEPAKGREVTWINRTILESYCALHEMGHAHSIEVWREDELVGGLYGVRIGAAFFGESMFSREADASKIAFWHLVARLRRGGFTLLDAQFQTPHLASLGAEEWPRARYRAALRKAVVASANFYELGPAGEAVSGLEVLHETTQTS
jgi:leucyl/phenylalanyl-tRNA--protein transferase